MELEISAQLVPGIIYWAESATKICAAKQHSPGQLLTDIYGSALDAQGC